MYNQQIILPVGQSVQRMHLLGKWVTILMIAIPTGIVARAFWDHGILLAAFLGVEAIALALWHMLCDFAAVCSQFVRFVFQAQL